MKKFLFSLIFAVFVVGLFVGCETGEKRDDWVYAPEQNRRGQMVSSGGGGGGGMMAPNSAPMVTADMAMESSSEELGFAVGGAKDIENFRENIRNGFLPILDDITAEGLFYDYFFDTGTPETCDNLFCPTYQFAVSPNPLTDEQEHYVALGLHSGIKAEDFQRKKLNLMIVMDISGSMGSPFNEYYYDQSAAPPIGIWDEVDGEPRHEEDDFWEDRERTKMEIANEAVVLLLDHLEEDDHLGMVLFDDAAYRAKNFSRVGNTDMNALKGHIREVMDQGGTNMESGIALGTEMFDELSNKNMDEYENRIIFITDAMPNLGRTGAGSLSAMIDDNAEHDIYTTFVGVGVDFNTELIEKMTKVRGANYFSVHSGREFKETMDEGFDYMVTPLVFDLSLQLETDGVEIEKVYGSPQADEATGEIMKVSTLFPSKTENGASRGGLVLLKLSPFGDDASMHATVRYTDRQGEKHEVREEVMPPAVDGGEESYESSGVRKGVALARYVDLMKDWIFYQRIDDSGWMDRCEPIVMLEDGFEYNRVMLLDEPTDTDNLIWPLPCQPGQGSQWERQSLPLQVSSRYRDQIETFADYFADEMDALDDEDLQQELDILEDLRAA